MSLHARVYRTGNPIRACLEQHDRRNAIALAEAWRDEVARIDEHRYRSGPRHGDGGTRLPRHQAPEIRRMYFEDEPGITLVRQGTHGHIDTGLVIEGLFEPSNGPAEFKVQLDEAESGLRLVGSRYVGHELFQLFLYTTSDDGQLILPCECRLTITLPNGSEDSHHFQINPAEPKKLPLESRTTSDVTLLFYPSR